MERARSRAGGCLGSSSRVVDVNQGLQSLSNVP